MIFANRVDAGQKLAKVLQKYEYPSSTIIIGLPRGGVVVAKEIVKILHLPLDIIAPRKMGAPDNPELALGAITADGISYLNEEIINILHVSPAYLDALAKATMKEAIAREKLYRKNRGPLDVQGKTVVLVDDGLATGATMKAAIASMRKKQASHIVVAVPVAPQDTVEDIRNLADEVICLYSPVSFGAVGAFYNDFRQTTDEEVILLLNT